MVQAWVTNSSTTLEAIINPLNAACDDGFVPSDIYLLENPGVERTVSDAEAVMTRIVESYRDESPVIHRTELESDHDFGGILAHFRESIRTVKGAGGEVAVDITPGRKYMSAIAFAAGMEYGADHVYHFYILNTEFYGQCYPNIPRTAMRLYDFTEEL